MKTAVRILHSIGIKAAESSGVGIGQRKEGIVRRNRYTDQDGAQKRPDGTILFLLSLYNGFRVRDSVSGFYRLSSHLQRDTQLEPRYCWTFLSGDMRRHGHFHFVVKSMSHGRVRFV
jgi:hypothetical protein